LDVVAIRERKKRFKKRFTSLRLVKLYYLTLVYKQFKKVARTARKKDGFFEGHYCLALEGRLIAFLYRTGFVASLFESLAYTKNALLTVNHKA
jgi:ribosomal protein S4